VHPRSILVTAPGNDKGPTALKFPRRAAALKVSNSENSTEHSKNADAELCVENCARI
jgi:hypothetical protein